MCKWPCFHNSCRRNSLLRLLMHPSTWLPREWQSLRMASEDVGSTCWGHGPHCPCLYSQTLGPALQVSTCALPSHIPRDRTCLWSVLTRLIHLSGTHPQWDVRISLLLTILGFLVLFQLLMPFFLHFCHFSLFALLDSQLDFQPSDVLKMWF